MNADLHLRLAAVRRLPQSIHNTERTKRMNMKERQVEAILAKWDGRARISLCGLSIERRRGKGQVCASCDAELSPPHSPGYRQCPRCQPVGSHAVYIDVCYLSVHAVWLCRFYENGNHAKLLREVRFARPEKLLETIDRGMGLSFELGRQRANHARWNCCGGQFWLQLTEEQLLRLRHHTEKSQKSEPSC